MKIIKQMGAIILCLAIGIVIKSFISFPIPETVIGMGVMFLALVTGLLKVEHVDETATTLVENIGFWVCPASVGIITVLDDIAPDIIKIWIVVIISTIVTLLVTAKTVQLIQRRLNDVR